MTEQELQEFKTRVKYAHHHGFEVGKADEYVAELAEEGAATTPPKGVAALSTAHLLYMIEQVEKSFAGSKPEPAKPKAEAKKAEGKKSESKKTETKIEVKAEMKAEAKAEAKPSETRDSADFTTVLEELAKEEMKAAADSWDVVLVDAGKEPIALVKVLREVSGRDLRDLESLVSSVPGVVKHNLSQADADAMKPKIEATGAVVEIRKAN